MLFKLILAFTLIPLIELWLLLKVGTMLGIFPTLVLVIGTGVAGASLARLQGLQTMLKVQKCIDNGDMPKDALIDALIILVAGIVLITPGILTDIAGILLLIPRSRDVIKAFIIKEVSKRVVLHQNIQKF